jgi:DNA-directed RNA polymerase specialized sigma24 family protein
LARIAVSETLAKLHKRGSGNLVPFGQEAEADGALMPQEVVDWGDNAEQRYTGEELRKIVHEAIQGLRPSSRCVFLLRDVAKLRTQEIADLLQLSVPSIKSLLLGADCN